MVPRLTRSGAFLFLAAAGLLMPLPASAQSVLAVNPTSISVTASAGTNAASQTVRVSNAGNRALKWSVVQPGQGWLSISPTIGVNSGTLTLTFRTSGMGTGSFETSFRIESNTGSSITIPVQLNLTAAALPPPPGQFVVTCPADRTVAAPTSSGVAVTYTVTTSGGQAPIQITGVPASGSLFPVGPTTVRVDARSADNQTSTCSFTVTVTFTATQPPAPSGAGPQSTIVCPSGAVQIVPGSNIQTAVNSFPGGTTFCIRAGTHSITSAVTPKSGNIFVGEYGAILDGSGWSTSDPNTGAFRSHNEDIDDVTIRNLVIRNMPQRGIHAYYWMSDRWTVEYNEITGAQIGISAPNNSFIRNNKIHHNAVGGYNGWKIVNTVFEGNEIAYNGPTHKVIGTDRVTFRNNFVHHNVNDGIFYDSDNTNGLIEGNRVEDNGRAGIFYEVSSLAVIRNNTVSRQGDTGIFISTAKDVEIYGNTLEDNFRAIQYFLNCDAVAGGTISFDLSNNNTHDNTIRVGNTSGAFANGFGYLSSCTSTQVAPYLSGSKNLKFTRNTYIVPSMTTRYWLWGLGALKFWNEWQALGQDAGGSASQ